MMNETPVLADAVRIFRPFDAAAYLRIRGWSQTDTDPGRVATWHKKVDGRGDFEVLRPLATHFRDYSRRVAELLDTLVAEERRPLHEIMEDLSTPNADIQRVRLPVESAWGGTLPLEDGSRVFQSIRDLVLAGASAAIQPRKAFGTRRPEQAMEYVRQTRIGRSKPGSFVISVIGRILTLFRAWRLDRGILPRWRIPTHGPTRPIAPPGT